MLSVIHTPGGYPAPVLVIVWGRMEIYQPERPRYLTGLKEFYKWTGGQWNCVQCNCPANDGHQLGQKHLKQIWRYCDAKNLDFIMCTIYGASVQDWGRNTDPQTGAWWEMGQPSWGGHQRMERERRALLRQSMNGVSVPPAEQAALELPASLWNSGDAAPQPPTGFTGSTGVTSSPLGGWGRTGAASAAPTPGAPPVTGGSHEASGAGNCATSSTFVDWAASAAPAPVAPPVTGGRQDTGVASAAPTWEATPNGSQEASGAGNGVTSSQVGGLWNTGVASAASQQDFHASIIEAAQWRCGPQEAVAAAPQESSATAGSTWLNDAVAAAPQESHATTVSANQESTANIEQMLQNIMTILEGFGERLSRIEDAVQRR